MRVGRATRVKNIPSPTIIPFSAVNAEFSTFQRRRIPNFVGKKLDNGEKYGKAGGIRVGRAARVNSSTIGEIYSRTIRLFPNNSMEYASVPVALQIISTIPRKKT
jgi:hypothetical protein